MPVKGERSHPLEGVKGAKKRLPKLPRAPEAIDLQEQSSIYLVERNEMMRLKRMREELLLAKERDQLIEKELAIKQLSYLMISMRQKLLAIAPKVGNRFGREKNFSVREVVEYVERAVHEALNELADLPLKVTDRDWMKRLEEEEE